MPIIAVNFKVYPQVMGEGALKLARICDEVASETGAQIIISPPMTELSRVAAEVDIPVFAQHADPAKVGSSTGHVPLELIRESGASGVIINHSEHRMGMADIEFLVKKSKYLGLETIVCTNNVPVSGAAAALNPNYVAIEPPELIRGDISVTTVDPSIVSNSVAEVRRISPDVSVLCGAGVKNGGDVKKAVELGAEGVLLASGVVKAEDPKSVLLNLLGY